MVMAAGGNHAVPDVERPGYRHLWPHTSLQVTRSNDHEGSLEDD